MLPAPRAQSYQARQIARLLRGAPAVNMPGFDATRLIGTSDLPQLDPFLRLDEWRHDAGKPLAPAERPYRGFDMITYMTAGAVHQGGQDIRTGEAQWLTAGRGLIQSTTPLPDMGRLHGFQFWLNLPAEDKGQAPGRRAIESADIPAVIFRTAEIRVLAGRYHGLMGPVTSPASPFIADVILKRDGDVALVIPEDHQGFIYVYEGGVEVEQTLVNPGQVGILDHGNVLSLTAGQDGARVLVVSARPLGEPVVRDNGFVATSEAELRQAIADYRAGRFA